MPINQLSDLMGDFVFRNRRIADQPFLRLSVLLADGDILRPVATYGSRPWASRDFTLRVGEGLAGMAFAMSGYAQMFDLARGALPELGDERIRSIFACPIVGGDSRLGVISLDSRIKLQFNPRDIPRLKVLSALVAYELFHLGPREVARSRLSEDIGRVLRSAREELKLSQDDLAALAGTSRIALSRWESGAQPPSRGPLRRWAAALGLRGGGRREIITIVDATSQLLEVVQRDPDRLSELSPEQFEVLVAERLDRMGYAVQRTGPAALKDGGIDIIAVPKIPDIANFLVAVQVKHHRGAQPTGRDAVDRLLSWQNTAFRLGLLVTNTRFTRDAIWVASRDPARHFLRLRDFVDLTRWLQGIFTSEQEWREIPDVIQLAPGVSIQVPKPLLTETATVWPLRSLFDPDA